MVNKTSRTFNEFSHIRPNQVRWNMVPSTPACCVPVLPASDILGFDEVNLKSRKTWGHKMAEIIPKREKNVERVCSQESRSKLILLNNLSQ